MWLYLPFGFYSITEVQDPKYRDKQEDTWPAGTLQVRARVREDLDNLRERYLPELSPTVELHGRDYPYRGYVTRDAMARAMFDITMSIDWNNFKNTVAKVQGHPRSSLYGQVWSVMYNAESKLEGIKEKERRQAQAWKRQGRLQFPFLDPNVSPYWEEDPVEGEAQKDPYEKYREPWLDSNFARANQASSPKKQGQALEVEQERRVGDNYLDDDWDLDPYDFGDN